MNLLKYSLVALLATSALAHEGCGTRQPTTNELLENHQIRDRFRHRVCSAAPDLAICNGQRRAHVIDVAFHVIYDPSTNRGKLTDQELQDQLRVIQEDYSGENPRGSGAVTSWAWNLVNVTYTGNANWFNDPETYEFTFKDALAIDPAHTVNQYFTAMPNGLLGWCYFPDSFPETSTRHGCVNHYQSVPGGAMNNYNLGATTTHEMGHGMGLYHVFQGGCNCDTRLGDQVDDTPCQRSSTSGCPATAPTTCTGEGPSSIHNFMDYSYDSCMYEFTEGQSERMDEQIALYRPSLLTRSFKDIATIGRLVPDAWQEAKEFQLRNEKNILHEKLVAKRH